MRGFGLSGWIPDLDSRRSCRTLRPYLAASIGNLRPARYLARGGDGHRFAARHPEQVRKLILVNAFRSRLARSRTRGIGVAQLADGDEPAEWPFRRSLLGEMFLTLYFPGASQALIDWHNQHFEKLGPGRTWSR